jgi:predicted transposase YbfD/YdcC
MPAPSSDDLAPTLTACFSGLEDPRREGSIDYPLHEIVILTVCAVICGADGFTAIESYGEGRKDWLGQFLELENGIPSHDTLGRFFGMLDPEGFEACFARWVEAACEEIDGEVVAIDGKTLRRSYDREQSKAALHMVSAWAAENQLTLGQVKTERKSNEITAVPELVEVLDLEDCIVTTDAMGCQKEITEAITNQEADYVLALKDNHSELRENTEAIFKRIRESDFEAENQYESLKGGHGRVETRRCFTAGIEGRGLLDLEGWSGLRTVALVEYERFESGGETSVERRYFVSSLDASEPEKILDATRTHWHIENRMHWVLDVAFDEDQSRTRKGHAAQNMAAVRRLALNLLGAEDSLSVGVKNKRLRAGWDPDYLLKVLQQV